MGLGDGHVSLDFSFSVMASLLLSPLDKCVHQKANTILHAYFNTPIKNFIFFIYQVLVSLET